MAKELYRFLGFAFASADLLVELGADGTITFAVGAAGRIANANAADLRGRPWRELVAEVDHPLVDSVLSGLQTGARRGPVSIELNPGPDGQPRVGVLSVSKLPEVAPAVSCAVSLGPVGQPLLGAVPSAGENKLHDGESFNALAKGLWEVARATGLGFELSLLEMPGLSDLIRNEPDEGSRAMREIAGALRAESYGGASAARLAPERFALMRAQGEITEGAAERIGRAAMKALGTDALPAVGFGAISFAPNDVTPEQAFRTLRHVLDSFIAKGFDPSHMPRTLGDAFQALVSETMDRAGAFRAIVEEQRFALVYQPVVSLADGAIHHHEVLARFAENESPFGLIRLAEEMSLIEPFDLAMVERVIERLKAKDATNLQLAVNISGQSLMSPTFMEGVMRLLKSGSGLGRRLVFEVTESAALTDLARADQHISALREAGFKVCLDDFGAGAASFPYLKSLTVDAVKIDGQYVRDIAHRERDCDLVRHIVALCKSLEITTTAEMVETEATANRLKELGVDFAQGWLYGKPQDEPIIKPVGFLERVGLRARRKGHFHSWG